MRLKMRCAGEVVNDPDLLQYLGRESNGSYRLRGSDLQQNDVNYRANQAKCAL